MFGIDKFLLFVALPVVVIASLIEALVLARRNTFDWRAAGVSLLDLGMRVTIQLVLPLSIATPLIVLAYQHRLGDIALDTAPALLALFIGRSSAIAGTTAQRTGCAGSGATTRCTTRRTSST